MATKEQVKAVIRGNESNQQSKGSQETIQDEFEPPSVPATTTGEFITIQLPKYLMKQTSLSWVVASRQPSPLDWLNLEEETSLTWHYLSLQRIVRDEKELSKSEGNKTPVSIQPAATCCLLLGWKSYQIPKQYEEGWPLVHCSKYLLIAYLLLNI